jgi:retinoid hydroxylase
MPNLKLPPGTTGLPLVGESLEFLFNPEFISKRYEAYGPVFKSNIIGRPTVFMVGPEAVEFVLSSHMDHFSWRDGWPDAFKTLLGESLFLQEGEEHRRNRRLIMPALHGPALASYFSTMETIAFQYFKKWEQQREFVWFDQYKQLTFDIASQLLLGTSSGPEVERLSKLFTTLTDGLFSLSPVPFPWTSLGRGVEARNQIFEHLEAVIEERQKRPTQDALSLLIQAQDEEGNRLSLKELKAQAMLMLFAGHETTTAMLTWICLEMGRHPEVLERARAEQGALTAKGPLSLEQMGQMPYLDQIMCEVERRHPPVAGGFRGVIKPFEFNGFHIPAGWLAQYSILITHRLSTVYPEPERFAPDRWSADQQPKRQPFSLIGFGGGPRVCVGIAFAKMEMKIIMSHLLRRYCWDLLPGQSLEPVIIPTRRPKDGLKVRFQAL